ncbi:SGNH/GDSL hydrolase family protein [Xanthobacter sp. V0B-10]|uniref:SGNH/GDSL hydrolase family protein n=1 Tax=Xanthobacter albus TaxID=3119929 RepID=UPI0037280B67
MTHAHASGASASRPRRLPFRLWPVLAALAALAAAAYGAHAIPPLSRIVTRHEAGSFLTDAPVALLGDSIAYANGPSRLCGEEVFNAAVPGARLKDLLGRGARIAERIHATRVVVAIGVNDAIQPHADIEEWTTQYRRLLDRITAPDITLVEINPVDPRFPVAAHLFDRDFIARQNAVIRALAAESGARLVSAPLSAQTEDGLHPNADGGILWRARLAREACDA